MQRVANSPCAGQSADAIAAWLKEHVAISVEVVVRHTQAGMLKYEMGKVIRLGKGRFEVGMRSRNDIFAVSGGSFYYSGKNCWEPKGQTRLVIPTTSVLNACEVCAQNGGFMPGGAWSITPESL